MYIAATAAQAEKSFSHIKQSFNATINSCNSIFLSRWYGHYRNISNIYSLEFNANRKMEIQEDIRAKVSVLEFVSDILVITPSCNSVISKNGWFTISDYCEYYKIINIENSHSYMEPPIIAIIDPCYCIIIFEDVNVRLEKGVICVLIDKNKFVSAMSNILPGNTVYAKAVLNGQKLYESGTCSEESIVNTLTLYNPSFTISIASPGYRESFMKSHIQNYLLTLVIMLLVSIMIAFLLTFVVTEPLNKLFLRIGGKYCKHQCDPYHFISEYLDSCSEHNKQLCAEKEHLKKFIFDMKNEVLLSMLTNPSFNFHDEYINSYIPWINYKYPYILILLKPKMTNELPDKSIFDEFSELTFRFISFPALNNDLCVIFWFENLSSAKEKIMLVNTKAQQLLESEYYFSISELLTDVENMRNSYLMLKNEIRNKSKSSLNPPVDLQIDFVNKIKANKADECIKLLKQSKFFYDPDSFVALLTNVALEHGIDLAEITTAYNWHRDNRRFSEQWSILNAMVYNICQIINTPHHKGTQLAESIRQYIEDNYCDPNLCVKQLADKYSIHRTLISKLLKAHLGISFSDYLLKLRIEKSLELLITSDMSIATIAGKVGFANYPTFKRAFIRYQHISPREYREYNKI